MSGTVIALAFATLISCATSVGLVCYVMLSQPLLEVPRRGLRGLKRARARAASSSFASLEPWLRWLGARIMPFSSSRGRAALAHKITIAGEVWGMWPAELRALNLLTACAGMGIGALCVVLQGAPPAIVFGSGALGSWLPSLQLARTGRQRVSLISNRLPHVVDMLVLSLGAGLDLLSALRQVVERAVDPQSAVIEELGLVLEELKLGHTRRRALERFAYRAPCEEVRDLVAACIQAEEQGTPLASVLQAQVSTSRQRRSARAEETASKVSTALLLPLLLILSALLILMAAPTLLETTRLAAELGV